MYVGGGSERIVSSTAVSRAEALRELDAKPLGRGIAYDRGPFTSNFVQAIREVLDYQ